MFYDLTQHKCVEEHIGSPVTPEHEGYVHSKSETDQERSPQVP